MTFHNRSLTMGGAIFAIVLSCFTGSQFAQSVDQSSDQDSPSAENATPIIPIDWADFDSFDTGYESSVAIHSWGLIGAVERMLQADSFFIQNEREVFTAMVALKTRQAAFADALIAALGAWAGCTATLTFDRKAARLKGFELA